jgi:hypothetical protein
MCEFNFECKRGKKAYLFIMVNGKKKYFSKAKNDDN